MKDCNVFPPELEPCSQQLSFLIPNLGYLSGSTEFKQNCTSSVEPWYWGVGLPVRTLVFPLLLSLALLGNAIETSTYGAS